MSATTPVDTRPLVYVGFAADIVHHGMPYYLTLITKVSPYIYVCLI
jgi:hypothetical protein